MKLRIFFFFTLVSFAGISQLDLKILMKGYDFIGYSPENIAWSLDGKGVYFTKKYDENGSFNSFYLDLKSKQVDTVKKAYLLGQMVNKLLKTL